MPSFQRSVCPEDGSSMNFWNVGILPQKFHCVTTQKTWTWVVVVMMMMMMMIELPSPCSISSFICFPLTSLCQQHSLREISVVWSEDPSCWYDSLHELSKRYCVSLRSWWWPQLMMVMWWYPRVYCDVKNYTNDRDIILPHTRKLPIEWLPRLKQPEHEAIHSPQSHGEVKNAWIHTSSLLIRLYGAVLG